MTKYTKRALAGAGVGLVLTMAFFSTGAYMALTESMTPDKPFDEDPAKTLAAAQERFTALSDESIDLYRSHLVRDVPFFLANGLLFGSVLFLIAGPGRSKLTYATCIALPALAITGDALENTALAMWFHEGGPTDGTVTFALWSTRLKFAAFMLMGLRAVGDVIYRIVRRSKTRAAGEGPVDGHSGS